MHPAPAAALPSERPAPAPGRRTALLRTRLLGIDPREATFARRGFGECDPAARARLEEAGSTFLRGYHAALAEPEPARLGALLDGTGAELRGFAYEGSAMALALLDVLVPWRSGRLDAFLRGPGDAHAYMVHVGAGWALARLRRRLECPPAGMDPLLGWLALDGYGFHEGYFRPGPTVDGREVPRRLSGYARRAFDQGVGRSLWFSRGADPGRIAGAVARFSPERWADLWSGVGLACAYAGDGRRGGADAVAAASGRHR
ncbi:MAG TPA: DUF1702 family protein, partial [Longimicrobiaceae bacterium]|nr:DUF1702 family protein [Longimicrobiaceae bacterium]